MSEADTSPNRPFPESLDLTDAKAMEQTNPSAEMTGTGASETPQLSSQGDVPMQQPEQRKDVVSSKIPSIQIGDESPGKIVRRLKTEPQISQGDVANLVVLTQELRQRNRDLLNRVTQLEQALEECKQMLESQIARSQAQETLFAQTTHELNNSQEQATRLFRELELSHQAAQRQQILIETLTEQLESSQERVAQLERECAATQQRYNEQSHQLLQSENNTNELRMRLQRQQRQTLQFKAALEKCLEVPALKEEVAKMKDEFTSPSAVRSSKTLTPIPKAQAIQPWSAHSEFLEQKPESPATWVSPVSPLSPSPLDFLDWDLEETQSDELLTTVSAEAETVEPVWFSTLEQEALEELAEEQPEIETISELLHELEAVLPSEPSAESTDESPLLEVEASTLDVGEVEEIPLIPVIEEMETEEEVEEVAAYRDIPVFNEPLTMEEKFTAEPESDAVPQRDSAQGILSQPNWPSPLVYPLRPPKGRKSLAAIDLPTFPRKTS